MEFWEGVGVLNVWKMISIVFISLIFTLNIAPFIASAQKAQIDFSEGNYDDFREDLNGGWTFFPGQYLTPEEVKKELKNNKGIDVKAPYFIKPKYREMKGLGTYSTVISLPDDFVGKWLQLYIPIQLSNYKVYIDDQLLTENKQNILVNTASDRSIQTPSPIFLVHDHKLRITYQIVDFPEENAGIRKSMMIGNEKAIQKYNERQDFLHIFLIGGITLIGMISLVLYIFKREERSFIAFSLFCFLTSTWGFFTDAYLITVFYDGIEWATAVRFAYLLPELVILLYLYYLTITYKDAVNKWAMVFYYVVMWFTIVITFTTETVVFQNTFVFANVLLAPFYIYYFFSILRKVEWKNRLELLTVFGISLVFLASLHDIYQIMISGNSIHYTFLALAVFIAIQCFILSREFALQWSEIECLNTELVKWNETLDEKIKIRTAKLEESNMKLRSLALLDGLTGAFNRHYFNKNYENLFQKHLEVGEPFSVLIIDVDEFKKYNDYYGHIEGDKLLRKLVDVLIKNLPISAQFTRYGGEEFAILVDRMGFEELEQLAEQLREVTEQLQLPHLGRERGVVTISIGGISLHNSYYDDALEVLKIADEQLYLAKNSGRNQVKIKNLG